LLTNTTSGTAPFTYLWDFGDSLTSTAASPSHTYAAPGLYTVILTATNFITSAATSQHVPLPPLRYFWPIFAR
jgi:immune inhibitor A